MKSNKYALDPRPWIVVMILALHMLNMLGGHDPALILVLEVCRLGIHVNIMQRRPRLDDIE